MHFNIWVNDNLIKDIESIMKETGHKRNKVITEAIAEYIKKRKSQEWPEIIKNFKGIKGLENWEGFEDFRKELNEPREIEFGGDK